ncbi:MAG: nickel/cobalt efflux transporter RcnA [Alphaproteobacteria bacterium]|nr:nickel/cobalt efflux transporter RcnA [Alphaproteobacteria bacterium]
MTSLTDLLQQGSTNLWLFIPSAIMLGALHGLEPGHSKTMMAAFIIAIRGTVKQAVLLGLAATISHTAVVWLIAIGGMYVWRDLNPEAAEPYFQIASAAIICAIALWMLWRTWQDNQHANRHGHNHHHDHTHDDIRKIDTGHGILALEVFEKNVPPRWRIKTESGHGWAAQDVTLETERPDGRRQNFTFTSKNGYLESIEEIPEPHEFMVRLRLSHGHHSHDYDVAFTEHAHGPHHDHIHEALEGLDVAADGYQDAHELAHANDIRRRFADKHVTTGQVILFGLTGGLIPCPAAITILLLCIQLKQIPLGATLVLCFSIGLALTLVTVGAVAAISLRQATKHFSWFGTLARKAPYVSSILILAIGIYTALSGWAQLAAR